jgi:5-methylcytosine-specific restriction endonuclease McrA
LSSIIVSSIIMVTGPVFGKDFYTRETVYAERDILYQRDMYLCAYCGIVGNDRNLTIDHVHPRSRGGKHTWTNTVTACKGCNHAKADRTPQEAGMELLYVPYSPNLAEKLLLKNRRILADQMEYLMATIPATSRARQLRH